MKIECNVEEVNKHNPYKLYGNKYYRFTTNLTLCTEMCVNVFDKQNKEINKILFELKEDIEHIHKRHLEVEFGYTPEEKVKLVRMFLEECRDPNKIKEFEEILFKVKK